jgi:hypothetical protein
MEKNSQMGKGVEKQALLASTAEIAIQRLSPALQ